MKQSLTIIARFRPYAWDVFVKSFLTVVGRLYFQESKKRLAFKSFGKEYGSDGEFYEVWEIGALGYHNLKVTFIYREHDYEVNEDEFIYRDCTGVVIEDLKEMYKAENFYDGSEI